MVRQMAAYPASQAKLFSRTGKTGKTSSSSVSVALAEGSTGLRCCRRGNGHRPLLAMPLSCVTCPSGDAIWYGAADVCCRGDGVDGSASGPNVRETPSAWLAFIGVLIAYFVKMVL